MGSPRLQRPSHCFQVVFNQAASITATEGMDDQCDWVGRLFTHDTAQKADCLRIDNIVVER
ncbi:hypothetical protein AW736_24175 [Termitidicoccus mucosus]|uniref:Uncharacterized protein n=1 Tax=Termitidicoccus mucosus TaxID=1184151 RepID=A0A178IBY6_9BACT|nr:hypothetical protein AW736_24175 [Opitutaceae bacterium TSB47]